jgi:CheY-like chemotaxis protein
MQMPAMDGLELARKIKADPSISPIKLIMLSSIWQLNEGEGVRQAGIEAFLTKPVKHSQLYDALATVMGIPEDLEHARRDNSSPATASKTPGPAPAPGSSSPRTTR